MAVAIHRLKSRLWRLAMLASAAALLLSACTSLAPTPQKSQALPATGRVGDLSGVVVAFDVPVTLQPGEQPSHFGYDVVTGVGERHVRAELTFAEVDVAGMLPVPANNRTYYLYEIGEKDRAALREAQAFAGTTTPSLSVSPQFCAVGPIDPVKATISVLLLVPGRAAAEPLIGSRPLASVLAASGVTLGACG